MVKTTANYDEISRVINAEHSDPFSVLGMHYLEEEKSMVVRAFFPNAEEIYVIDVSSDTKYQMTLVDDRGFFEVLLKEKSGFFKYVLEVTDSTGNTFSTYDPYSFLPVLTDLDFHLFNEGNHHKIYDKLGAHMMTIDGVQGTLFAVWAPCAKRVSVVGSFNQWDGRRHVMRSRGPSGIWELFIPGLKQGDLYKYEIKTPHDELYVKTDPYAFYCELRPNTASIVYDIDDYKWNDDEWMKERDNNSNFEKPISVYEVHLGSWKRVSNDENGFHTYRELADDLVEYVKYMGYTHIQLLPVSEHPFDGSWGYQITGYYAATSRHGEPKDFMYFVDKCHQNGIGVLVDWVPAHFPKDGHGLARFDGTALYEHYDEKQGEHPDWGTHVFNYGRLEVKNFLISNALFWLEKYHIDGLRVDAVASMLYLDYGKKDGQWLPNRWGGKENVDAIDFMRQLNSTVYGYYPGVTMVAEESTSWALVTKPPYVGGLGFSYKWNMGWMNDFLTYMSMDSVYRKHHQNLVTFSLMYAFSENFILVLSHDEVVHGKCSMIEKMPGDYWQKFAGLRASYGYMYGHPGKKLLFMGCEFAQFIEWNYKQSLDWHLLDYDMHTKMQNYVRDLNALYKNEKALFEVDFHYEGFEWIDCNDNEHSIISFIRKGKDWRDSLVFLCNFTPTPHDDYRIGVPFDTEYTEVFNSDWEKYGGSNVGNFEPINAQSSAFHDKPYSINVKVPPLATIVLKPKLK
ncbi:1,4-alpha-glucan branching protein GlgB [Herbivorax sp. ANBcel31]|uniref:1,4-alpha-glucan branching protein GlgB n=1 Tax=Herbivorax sp. ANBcel31 TaxID=3069754 RepID=UPI0027B6927A|nr:1,4-alpha-glucan branching protein GlgB [Herbivorax sp. ANBcel31]MDQ2085146.1 1,4-alpha-glucan branching protein GlgB [Herbivorax sp. ANBcel31]